MAPQSNVPPTVADDPIGLSRNVKEEESAERIGDQLSEQLERERAEELTYHHLTRRSVSKAIDGNICRRQFMQDSCKIDSYSRSGDCPPDGLPNSFGTW
jgi:hypothetical protein